MDETRGGWLDRKRLEGIIALAVFGLVVAGCLLVLAPFVSVLLWVGVICFSTWGIYERVLDLTRGRRGVGAGLMMLLLAVVLIGPFVLVAASFAEDADSLTRELRRWMAQGLPGPPEWVAGLPLVGGKLAAMWQSFAEDSAKLYEQLRRLMVPAGKWLAGAGLTFVGGLLQLAMGVLIAYFLYRDGETLAAYLRAGMDRIAGARAQRLLEIVGGTVKGVVYGILGTALAQGIVGGLGYWIAGVPGPFLLGLVTCLLALVPMGPPLVWIPAAFWLFHEGETGWGIFMAAWGLLAVSGIDNFVKPYLISQGSALPFILVLLGVLGGVLAFGITGIFLGPTLLAVGYALVRDWTRAVGDPPGPAEETTETAR